jgi:NitT/TauT family transport system permease protein
VSMPMRRAPRFHIWSHFLRKTGVHFSGKCSAFVAKWYSVPLLLVLWQVAVSSGLVTSRLLPSLVLVWDALVADVRSGVLPLHAGVTVARALAGFALAVIVGVPLGAAMARAALLGRLFEPFFFLGYPVPKIALFPVFTFIFGFGSPSKIAFTFLECLYPIVVMTFLGVRGIQTRLIWTAQNMGADRPTILRRVIAPAVLPGIFAGMRIALPLAIVVVVVTEMIGDTKGLGYYITIWSTRFRYANVYAGILTIGLIGFVLDQMLTWWRGTVIRWEPERRSL